MSIIRLGFSLVQTRPTDYSFSEIYNSPGNYQYTVPDRVWSLKFVLAGGGGGGGGAYSLGASCAGGGGGGGQVLTFFEWIGAGLSGRFIHQLPVYPGEVLEITVGAGGFGATSSDRFSPDYNATSGGDTSITGRLFGTITAYGGFGGGTADQRLGASWGQIVNGGGPGIPPRYPFAAPTLSGDGALFAGIGGAGGGTGGKCPDKPISGFGGIIPGPPAPQGLGEDWGGGGAGGNYTPLYGGVATGGDGGAAAGSNLWASGGNGTGGICKLWTELQNPPWNTDIW
jgi:hypothetical protein